MTKTTATLSKFPSVKKVQDFYGNNNNKAKLKCIHLYLMQRIKGNHIRISCDYIRVVLSVLNKKKCTKNFSPLLKKKTK